MDSSAKLVDTVKVGKAKAALRRRRTSQLKNLMHVIEACVVLLILLSWCSGSSLSLAVDHSLRLLDVFRKPLSVFLLSNGIIIVIAFLSGTGDRKQKTTGTSADFSERIYDEYLSRRGITQVTSLNIPVAKKPTEENSDNKLQIVPYVPEPRPAEPLKPAVSRASPCPTHKVVSRVISPTPAVTTSKVGERHYRRTRSSMAVKSCKQENDRALRRSITENARGMACREPAKLSVDDLSNEEFNQTVENYIARTRQFLQTELMADQPTVVPKESHSNNSNIWLSLLGTN